MEPRIAPNKLFELQHLNPSVLFSVSDVIRLNLRLEPLVPLESFELVHVDYKLVDLVLYAEVRLDLEFVADLVDSLLDGHFLDDVVLN